MKINRCVSILLLVLCCMSPAYAGDNLKQRVVTYYSGDDIVRGEIEKRVEALRSNGSLTIKNEQISSRTVLPALYQRHDFSPVWINEKSVEQLILVLETIDDDGLESSDYHLPLIKKIRAQLITEEPVSPVLLAEFDLLLSDSLARLGYHLLMGKVDPVELDTNWNMDRTVGDLDQVIQMSITAIADGSVVGLIQNMRPQVKVYAHLHSALAHYRDIEAKGGWGADCQGSDIEERDN